MPHDPDPDDQSSEVKLSLVVSTRNEASNIAPLVANAAGVDEIVIGDMASSDGTPDLARAAGATVVELENAGYAEPGRMTAIEAATGDWILVLDADERLPPGGVDAIRRLCAGTPATVAAYRIPRVNYLGSRAIRGSGWNPEFERHARLFRAGTIDWGPELHSRPTFDGKVLDLADDGPIRIDHANFRDYAHLVEKLNDYSTIEAAAVVRDGRTLVLPLALRFALEELVNRYEPDVDGSFSLALSLALFAARFDSGAKVAEADGWPDDLTIAQVSMLSAVNRFWAELRRLEIQRIEAALQETHEAEGDDGATEGHAAALSRALTVWREQPPTLSMTTVAEGGTGFDGPWEETRADDAASRAQVTLAHLQARLELRAERRARVAAEAMAAERSGDADEALQHLADASAALAHQLWLNEQLQRDLAVAQAEAEALESRALEAEASLASITATGRRLVGLTRQRLRGG